MLENPFYYNEDLNMANDERKKAALAASDKSDRLADSVLGKVMLSSWSWAILLVSHLAAFGLGAWLF